LTAAHAVWEFETVLEAGSFGNQVRLSGAVDKADRRSEFVELTLRALTSQNGGFGIVCVRGRVETGNS